MECQTIKGYTTSDSCVPTAIPKHLPGEAETSISVGLFIGNDLLFSNPLIDHQLGHRPVTTKKRGQHSLGGPFFLSSRGPAWSGRLLVTQEITGSNPVRAAISCPSMYYIDRKANKTHIRVGIFGSLAHSEEQGTLNPQVPGA